MELCIVRHAQERHGVSSALELSLVIHPINGRRSSCSYQNVLCLCLEHSTLAGVVELVRIAQLQRRKQWIVRHGAQLVEDVVVSLVGSL